MLCIILNTQVYMLYTFLYDFKLSEHVYFVLVRLQLPQLLLTHILQLYTQEYTRNITCTVICEFCSLVGNVSGGGASTHSHTIQVQGERANPWQKPPLSHTEANPASMELHSDSGSDTYRWTINRHCWNYLLIEHALYHYFSSISPSFTYTLHCVGIGFCLRPVVVYTNYTVIGHNKDGPANVFGH